MTSTTNDYRNWLDGRLSNVKDVTRKTSFLITGAECANAGRMVINRCGTNFVDRRYFDEGTFGTISLFKSNLNVVSKRFVVRRDECVSEYDIHRDISFAVRSGKCVNFPLLYFATKCTGGCGGASSRCVEMIIEKFDGNFLDNNPTLETKDDVLSLLYQLLRGAYDMHYKCGVYHRDIKLDNILFKRLPCKNVTITYDDDDCKIVNTTNLIPIIADFGSAWSVRYRDDLKSRFCDMVYEFVHDDDGPIRALQKIKCKRLAVRNNLCAFPPIDFLNDVQDVIRLFVGGARTSMPHQRHDTFNVKDNEELLEELRAICYVDTKKILTKSIIDAKYVFSDEMMTRVRCKFERLSRSVKQLQAIRCCDRLKPFRRSVYFNKLVEERNKSLFERVGDSLTLIDRQAYILSESTSYSRSVTSLMLGDAVPSDVKVKKSIILQTLDAIRYLHEMYGIAHDDLISNVRYSNVDEKETTTILDGRLEIPTYGYYVTVWNFDKARSFKPKYSLDGFYGTRNASYARRLSPIYVEGNACIDWILSSSSSLDYGSATTIKSPSSELLGTHNPCSDFSVLTRRQLDDTKRYPAFEFSRDIRDVFRLFDDTVYGGDSFDVYDLSTAHLAVVASARIKHIVNKQKSC